MGALKKVHNERLMVRFDDSETSQDREIDILTREVTRHFNSAGNRLKRIASKSHTAAGVDDKVTQNIQR